MHCGTITSVTRHGFRQILHADQKCDGFYLWCFRNHKSDVDMRFYFRGVRIRISAVLGSGQHIFQRIDNKFHTELKLSNAHFALSGEWERKYEIQIGFLGMCKFQFRFRLVHCKTITPTILYRFSTNVRLRNVAALMPCLWDQPEVVFRC